MIFSLATGFVCFLVYAVSLVAARNSGAGARRGLLAIRLAPLLALASAAIVFAAWAVGGVVPQGAEGLLVSLLWAELTFFGLLVLFVPALYAVTHSISLATLALLAGMPGQRMPADRLATAFTSRAFLESRLAAMVDSGYLEATGSAYLLTPLGRVVARRFARLQELWRLGPGG